MFFMYLELIGKSLSLFRDDLEAIRGSSTIFFEIMQNLRLVLRPMSNDHFSCQVLHLVTFFASRVQ